MNKHWLDRSPGWILPYEEAFLEGLARTMREDAKILNIGAAVGTSTSAILRGVYNLQSVEVVSIDIEDAVEERSTLLQQGLLDESRFKQIVIDSNEFGVNQLIELDMVFIDGSHKYTPILKDLRNFALWLKPGGLLVVHDYQDPRQPDVTRAVDRWVAYKKNADWLKIGQVIYTVAYMRPGGDMNWTQGRLDDE